jgi:hypothetical protein
MCLLRMRSTAPLLAVSTALDRGALVMGYLWIRQVAARAWVLEQPVGVDLCADPTGTVLEL